MDEKKNTQYLTIQSLGRACYLGQLYSATTNTLLPGFRLYRTKDIVPIKGLVNTSNVTYKEIRGLKDRASSLNISASLEVSILSGAITIGGMGSYLESKEDTSESITVASVAQYRTHSESLDINSLRHLEAMTASEVTKTRATHVVVSIVYGGNVVGSLTQKNDSSSTNTEIKGGFKLEVFKGMGKMFGAGGSADLSVEEKEKLNSYNLDVALTADFSMAEEKVPASAPDMLDIFKKSAQLVGDGVPCEVVLAPLSMFQDNTPSFRELTEADLVEITDLYDRILTLSNSRTWLLGLVENSRELFPTFHDECRTRGMKVTELVQRARDELRQFLEAHRAAHVDVKAPSEFREEVDNRFVEETKMYERDLALWKDLVQRMRAGDIQGFPPVSVNNLAAKMNRPDKGVIAMILVPETVKFANLLNTYRVIAKDIYTWRSALDKDAGSETEYVSVYADQRLDAALLQLDDDTKSLQRALDSVRSTSEAGFLTYGLSKDGLGQLEWSVLNQEGWGVLVNRSEGWHYIGDVRSGVPHGSGVMTYADHTKYTGDWVYGKRDGRGELLDAQGTVVKDRKGVYMDNLLASDGIMVVVTAINKNQIPVQSREVALSTADSVRSQVDRIGRVMKWRTGQRFRLEVQTGQKAMQVVVNGSSIDPEEDPDVEFSFWPLDRSNKYVIKAFVL